MRPRFMSTAAPLIRTSMDMSHTKQFDASPAVSHQKVQSLSQQQQQQQQQLQQQRMFQEQDPTTKMSHSILREMNLQVQHGAEDPFYVVDLNSASSGCSSGARSSRTSRRFTP